MESCEPFFFFFCYSLPCWACKRDLILSPGERQCVSAQDTQQAVFIQQMKHRLELGRNCHPAVTDVLNSYPADIFASVDALQRGFSTLLLTSFTIIMTSPRANWFKTRLTPLMSGPQLNHCTFLLFNRKLSTTKQPQVVCTAAYYNRQICFKV